MTELNLGASYISGSTISEESSNKSSRRKRVIVAFLLSLFAPGLGQVYRKKPERGLAMALSLSGVLLVAGELRLLSTFIGLAGSLLVSVLWRLWITGDACYLAWKGRPGDANLSHWRFKSIASAAIILFVGVYPIPDVMLKRWSYFRAYKVPSISMCPMICEGDRIVANMDAFKKYEPKRGEIVLVRHPGFDSLLIKRVIGVEGDTVSESGGKVYVDGGPLSLPVPPNGCEVATPPPPSSESRIQFEPTTVPASSFFVVGDNLTNSLDSRVPEFGLVRVDQVRGKPAFIYWSRQFSRIGCQIR